VDTSLASAITVQAGATFAGSGSTSQDLTIQTDATVAVRPGDWDSPRGAFSAARVIGTGASAWKVRVDATGLTNFSETSFSMPFLVGTGGMPDIDEEKIKVDASGFNGTGKWSVSRDANTLSLVYTPDLYAVWAAGIDWNGSDPSPGADPDADGLVNLMEYALASNPLLGDGGAPELTRLAGGLRLSFQRVADPTLLYEIITTSDLSSPAETWSVLWSSTGAANTAGWVTVDDLVPAPAPARRFLRLRVTR
jgi:hypothetical protein